MITEIEFNHWKDTAKKSKNLWRVTEAKVWRFQEAPLEVQLNHELNIIAVIEGKDNLYQLHPQLQNSRDFMLEILAKEGTNNNYIHMLDKFKADEEFIRLAFKNNCNIILYAPQKTQKEKELIYKLLSENGLAYQHLTYNLREDLEVCKIAAKQNPAAMEYMTKTQIIQLCKDKNWIKNSLDNNPAIFKFCPYSIRNNLLYAIPAIKNDSNNVEYATDKIKNSKEWAFELISNYNCRIYHFNKEVQSDKRLILESVKKSPWDFRYIPIECQNDVDLVCEAIKINKVIYAGLPEKIQNNFTVLSTLWTNHGEDGKFYINPKIREEMKDMSLGDYVLRQRLFEKLDNELEHKQQVINKSNMNKFKL